MTISSSPGTPFKVKVLSQPVKVKLVSLDILQLSNRLRETRLHSFWGQANKAVEPFRSASILSPDSFTPKLNLRIALLETRQFAAAETQLREALRQNDTAPTAHMYFGVALTRLGNYPEAEKELSLAIETSDNRLELAHYYLGGIYWGRGQYRRAADELETYLRLTANVRGCRTRAYYHQRTPQQVIATVPSPRDPITFTPGCLPGCIKSASATSRAAKSGARWSGSPCRISPAVRLIANLGLSSALQYDPQSTMARDSSLKASDSFQ